MKILNNIQKTLLLLMAVSSMTGLFFGCQQDLVEIKEINPAKEKSALLQSVPMTGTLPDGALYEIVLPEAWNYLPKKILLVYAHGYVDPVKPVALPSDSIADGMGGLTAIKDFVVGAGMGYASTSYRDNGLVVLDAVKDIVSFRLVIQNYFGEQDIASGGYLPPDAVLLVGPSEGGLITVLTIEQNPGIFDAAMATCCPIGNFYDQLQYYGDAHVLFKYFFGPVLNGINLESPKRISKHTMEAWEDGSLQNAIIEALQNDYMNNGGKKIIQFLNCAKIPANQSDPVDVVKAILEVLRFPFMATNDAIERLGGNPYNNKYPERIYTGSENDRKLNLTVERIKMPGWELAARNVGAYETSGELLTPLLTMHTEFDPVSLYWHQTEYIDKVSANSPYLALLIHIKVPGRYGHCNFTVPEIIAALGNLSE